jgi:hypothetical protein
MLIDKALNQGATSCRRSRHPTTAREGLVFRRPSDKGKQQAGPLPAAGEATTA